VAVAPQPPGTQSAEEALMKDTKRLGPAVITIFGAAGDLAWRKLVPSLFSLSRDGWLSERFAVVGVDRNKLSDEKFRDHLRDGVASFCRYGRPPKKEWDEFAARLSFRSLDLSKAETYSALNEILDKQDESWKCKANRVYYLAVPPALVGEVVDHLNKAGLCQDWARSRVVVEKPFGSDLDSARALNQMLAGKLGETQLYRIDHYLGKETVQNILAFRFANALFEPIWDRRYIDHVQITVAEDVGIEHRGSYYDRAGALRDMVQNHLMQLLCLIAMEPPVSFDAEEVRNRKVDVLHAIRPIPEDDVGQYAARGQYGAGWIRGERVPGYREEPDVDPESDTETFAALKLFVDNWRWQNVPFYLRTGKRLLERVSEVSIHFRPVPHQAFPSSAIADMQPNSLVIHVQPDEGILLRFQAKRPGLRMRLSPVDMHFMYQEAFEETPPEAYETLLLDIMEGDSTLFMRADQIEAAWSVLMPVLNAWAQMPPADFPNYQAGTWGMQAASVLIAQDGRSWVVPTAARMGKAAAREQER
jgi:glucose-6-phosphate 1-dehydrogenase